MGNSSGARFLAIIFYGLVSAFIADYFSKHCLEKGWSPKDFDAHLFQALIQLGCGLIVTVGLCCFSGECDEMKPKEARDAFGKKLGVKLLAGFICLGIALFWENQDNGHGERTSSYTMVLP